jgi:hypothetical protein
MAGRKNLQPADRDSGKRCHRKDSNQPQRTHELQGRGAILAEMGAQSGFHDWLPAVIATSARRKPLIL